MKKNDTMGYVVYGLMLAVALVVALVFVRPIMNEATPSDLPLINYVYVLVLVAGGILVTSALLELGHLIGAKIGHYSIDQWTVLGLGVKRQKNGKMKFTFSDFDGLTGGTVIVPLDLKKSNPRPYIYMPFVFFLLEVIGSVVLIALGRTSVTGMPLALQLAGILLLTVSGMIYLYDIFPAALDGTNDGYLMTVLNSKANVEAYNDLLLKQHQIAFSEKVSGVQIYEKVTDFTAAINSIPFYEALGKGDYLSALDINEKIILSKGQVSSNLYQEAIAEKTALSFLTRPLEEAKQSFIDLPLESKKHIAELGTIVAVRAYVLVSGLAEESVIETEAALEKAERGFNKLPKDRVATEKKLLAICLEKVIAAHPDWDLSAYDYLRQAEKPAETPKDEPKKPEDK